MCIDLYLVKGNPVFECVFVCIFSVGIVYVIICDFITFKEACTFNLSEILAKSKNGFKNKHMLDHHRCIFIRTDGIKNRVHKLVFIYQSQIVTKSQSFQRRRQQEQKKAFMMTNRHVFKKFVFWWIFDNELVYGIEKKNLKYQMNR